MRSLLLTIMLTCMSCAVADVSQKTEVAGNKVVLQKEKAALKAAGQALIVIDSVFAGSLASQAGFREYDTIYSVNGIGFNSTDEFLAYCKPKRDYDFTIARNGYPINIRISKNRDMFGFRFQTIMLDKYGHVSQGSRSGSPPSRDLILQSLSHFAWDDQPRANKEEIKRMLDFLGAAVVHEFKWENGGTSICGKLPSGYEITIWDDSYGNTDTYSVRYGLFTSNHSYFGSNETLFEIDKIRKGQIKDNTKQTEVSKVTGKGTLDLVIQSPHAGTVTSGAFSEDGQYLLTGSTDRTAKLWEVRSGREVRTFRGHSGSVTDVAVDPKIRHVFTGSEDHTIRMFEAETGKLEKTFEHSASVRCISVTREATYLAAGGFEMESMYGELAVWDIRNSNKLYSVNGGIYALQFSPDGKYLAYSNWGGDEWSGVWLLDAETGQRIRQLDASTDATTLSFNLQGTLLAIGNANGGLRIFDVFSGRLLSSMETQAGPVGSIAFSANGQRLISVHPKFLLGSSGFSSESGSTESTLKVFEVQSGKEVASQRWEEDVQLARFSKEDSKILLLGDGIHWWNMENKVRNPLADTKHSSKTVYPRKPAYLTYFSEKHWDISGSLWETITGEGLRRQCAIRVLDSLRVTDIQTGLRLFSLASSWDTKHALNSDGSLLVVSDEQGVVLRSLPSGRALRSFQDAGQFDPTTSLDFSPDSRYLVTGSGTFLGQGYPDNSVRIWDVATGKLLRKVNHPTQNINGTAVQGNLTKINVVRFSPDGKYVACGSGDTWWEMGTDYDDFARLWDVETGKEMAVYGVHNHNAESRHSAACIGHTKDVAAIAFSSSGRLIATGGDDNKIFVWETFSGKQIGSFSGHTQSIRNIAFNFDETQIVSRSSDGVAKLWSLKDGQEIATLVAKSDKDFAIILPDGYYASTHEGTKSVHFVKGLKIYTLENFDLIWNRPDIVLKRVGNLDENLIGAYRKAYEKRLLKMGFDPNNFEKERSFNVPEIALTGVASFFAETSSSTYDVSFSASDQLYNLDRLFVEINGVPFYGVKGKTLARSKTIQQTIQLPLSSGKNVIKLSVLNEKGVESLAERIEVTYKPTTMVKPNLHVIAVGVSQFAQSDYNLTYADKDARDLSALFQSATGYGSVKIHLLPNEQATRANVLALRGELEKTAADDQVVVFLASHGVLDDELDYYIAMHDMDFANPKNGGLRYDELENLIDQIPARNKLILIDACHSGEVDKEESQLVAVEEKSGSVKTRAFKKTVKSKDGIGLQNSFELMKELFADLRRNNGAVVISSASGKEYALESAEWKNGVFTYSILEGLRSGKADLNQDKTLTVSELRDYVGKRVQELTNGKQNPTSRTENLENDFRVW